MKESLTVNSICIISDRMSTKNFASLYARMSITDRMDLNGGNPLLRASCILANP